MLGNQAWRVEEGRDWEVNSKQKFEQNPFGGWHAGFSLFNPKVPLHTCTVPIPFCAADQPGSSSPHECTQRDLLSTSIPDSINSRNGW